MEIQLQIIWSACVVYFGFILIHVQAHNQMVEQVVTSKGNDESKIQKNFQNLLNSIMNNNTRNSEIYSGILKQEIGKEQKVFDSMKIDLLMAQSKNAFKKRNFYRNSDTLSGTVVMAKRDAAMMNPANRPKEVVEIPTERPAYGDQEDDDFIEVFGNNNETSGTWNEVKAIASNEQKMKKLCKEAHRKMRLGADDVVNRVKFGTETLIFHNYEDNSTYRHPIKLDMVTYGVERVPETSWYFTKGTKSYCVFYLTIYDAAQKLFQLGLEVCGVHVPIPAPSP